MNHTPEQRPYYDDEISLVDLAATFIRRRRVFYAVFILVTLAGLAYALLAKETYHYVSLLQAAERSSGKYLEEPATTIATLQNRWLPEQEAIFRAETEKKLPFQVSFSNPEDTGLIRILSEGASGDKDAIEKVHQNLIESVEERHKALIEIEKRKLLSRIDSIVRSIETLEGGEDTGAAIAEALERKVGFEGDLAALKEAEVLVVSRQSAEKTGPARGLIVVLSVVLGSVFGVFLAFFAQFVVLVRSQVAAESDSGAG